MKAAKLVVVVVLGLVLGLTLSAAMGVYAQGGGEEEKERDSQGVSGEGLNDPPPAGMSVLYTFTGARYETTTGRQVATVVHCTNYGAEDATVAVEIFEWDDLAPARFLGQTVIPSNYTVTFSTQETNIYRDFLMSQATAENINQGSGRVSSDKRTLICTAQVIDPADYKPYFAIRLPLYYPDGTQVGVYYVGVTYLPVIVRQ